MKLRTIFYTISIGVTALGMYACDKSLNALPSQMVVDENVVVDQPSAQIALNGAYYRFANSGTNLAVQSTIWSLLNELTPAMLAGNMRYFLPSAGASTENNNIGPSGTAPHWTYPYQILNAANGTIAGVEAVDDSKFVDNRKKEILAEARFLRAYAHFYLLSFFSEWYDVNSPHGVLLREQPLRFGEENKPRSSVKESYDHILQDLDYTIAQAKDNNPVYYVNKAAAKALKIRVLTNRGLQTDYATIITLADELINNPTYALESHVKDLFQTKGHTSKEVIFGITPYPTQRNRNAAYEYIQSTAYLPTEAFRNLMATDPRASWMFAPVPNTPATATIFNMNLGITPHYMIKYRGAKYEEPIVLRMTEVHLLKAEAIARSGGDLDEAKGLLKNILSHAGITDFSAVDNATTAEQVVYQIYLEITKNMVSENGADWFALLRQPFETVKTIRPTIVSKTQYILPIPTTEFQRNPGIGDQNPGYPKEE